MKALFKFGFMIMIIINHIYLKDISVAKSFNNYIIGLQNKLM